jgi:type IV pilus assembly protein PilQ
MKLKCTLTLVGLVAWSLAGYAQSTPPAGEPPASDTSANANKDAAPPAAAPADNAAPATANSTTPPAAESTAPATGDAAVAKPVEGTPPPVVISEPAPATLAQADTSAKPAEAPAAAPAAVDAKATAGAVIPLIVMDDVPLTDAIKNLARQAGLNYMLDPKVSFGQIGPDGKTIPQPQVSIRWENITAEQALTSLLGNYNLQLVEDPKSKIARVTVKDPAAPDPLVTRVIQLKYANPSNVVSAVTGSLSDKRSKVIPDIRTSQLVLVATEKELVDVEMLVEKLDTPTKQVLIEARLLETSMNPETHKGMDWAGTLEAQNLAFGNNLKQNSPSDSMNNTLVNPPFPKILFDTAKGFNPATAFLDADGVSAVFSFLNKYSEARVISAPRTVTLDNETAKIEVTRASPIINVTPGTVQVAGGSQITYTNLGIMLNVTPRISAENYVNLKVLPEVSRVSDRVKVIVNNGIYEADAYAIRRMETRVMIPSGNTLVLGGLIQDDVREGNTKVPLLGDIPYIGRAFRSDSKTRQKSNLTIFLTPTIIQDGDFQPTQSDYLKTPVPLKDEVEGEWSAWDSGKPKDWSKPSAAKYDAAKFAELPKEEPPVKVTEAPKDQPKAAPEQPKFTDLPREQAQTPANSSATDSKL